jgi:osmotically-inducible protein OsmY
MRSALFGALLLAFGTAALAADQQSSPRPTDEKLAEWVREALAADPRIDAVGVEVAVEKGIATLRGSVPTLVGKRYGLLNAQRIHGVLAVVDQVDVDAAERPDAEIARDVERRIRRSRALAGLDIAVSAQEAVVRLAGRVQSWSQRLEADLLASEVRGVSAVDNQLAAELEATRSDAEIQADVEASLRRDAYLAGLAIDVVVLNGLVQLSGSVSSPYERTRAAAQVGWVANVRGLENLLQVEWWPDRSARVAAPEPRSDVALARIVKAELVQDDRIDASGIDVVSSKGHVTLRGSVPSVRQRRLADEDVRSVIGVAWLTNELDVAFQERPDDEVKNEIEQSYASDSALFESSIAIEVQHGVVTLTGDVGSGYHRAHAAAIASRTRGVQEVVNRLRTIAVQVAADEALVREIERRLQRDARMAPIADRVNVGVEQGVVTLEGDVDHLAERRAAERIAARTPGVRRVRNQLVVDPYPYPWEDHPEQEETIPDWYWDFPELPWIARTGSGNGAP